MIHFSSLYVTSISRREWKVETPRDAIGDICWLGKSRDVETIPLRYISSSDLVVTDLK